MVNQEIFKEQKARAKIIGTITYEQKYSLLKELIDNLGKGTFRSLIKSIDFDDYSTAVTNLHLLELNNMFGDMQTFIKDRQEALK